jgi:hypothetical protein
MAEKLRNNSDSFQKVSSIAQNYQIDMRLAANMARCMKFGISNLFL